MDKVTLDLEIGEAKDLLVSWEQSLQQLQTNAADLEKKILATKAKIASLRAKLQGQELLLGVQAEGAKPDAGSTKVTERAPRGHNLRVIRTFLEGVAPDGRSPSEIAHATGVGLSSVQAVLLRSTNMFEQTPEKKWKMNPKFIKSADNPADPERITPDGCNHQG